MLHRLMTQSCHPQQIINNHRILLALTLISGGMSYLNPRYGVLAVALSTAIQDKRFIALTAMSSILGAMLNRYTVDIQPDKLQHLSHGHAPSTQPTHNTNAKIKTKAQQSNNEVSHVKAQKPQISEESLQLLKRAREATNIAFWLISTEINLKTSGINLQELPEIPMVENAMMLLTQIYTVQHIMSSENCNQGNINEVSITLQQTVERMEDLICELEDTTRSLNTSIAVTLKWLITLPIGITIEECHPYFILLATNQLQPEYDKISKNYIDHIFEDTDISQKAVEEGIKLLSQFAQKIAKTAIALAYVQKALELASQAIKINANTSTHRDPHLSITNN